MHKREKRGFPKPTLTYDERENWACKTLADTLEKILIEFGISEEAKIRTRLGNYTLGYLGLSWGLKFGRD